MDDIRVGSLSYKNEIIYFDHTRTKIEDNKDESLKFINQYLREDNFKYLYLKF